MKLETIKLDLLVNCLGYSIDSDEFKSIINRLDCATIDEHLEFRDDLRQFRISFTNYESFNCNYGIPIKALRNKKDEPILKYIVFSDLKTFEIHSKNIELPFSLAAGLTKQEVQNKIGLKPYFKQMIYLPEWKEGLLEYYDCPNFQVEAYYDEKNSLFELMFNLITKEERTRLELKESLKVQKKNINPKFIDHVNEMHQSKNELTHYNNSSKEIESDFEKLLTEFIDNCAKFTKSRNANAIFNSVKKLVENINNFIGTHPEYIETIGRDSLCDFIHETVKRTGFQIESNIDLTEEWREW